ncbi:MAG TPA: amidohydrolase family protein [Bordetella sp.]
MTGDRFVPDCRPPLAAPSPPRRRLPEGACDTHCHVFGPADRFPYAEGRSYTPPDAPFEKLAALHAHLGAAHAVIVQANCHGHDHAALLDAVARSQGRYRGVALLPPQTDAAMIRALHAGGVRGARFNFVPHLGAPPSPEAFDRMVSLIAPFGWHVCLHVDGAMIGELLPRLAGLPVPFVVDHMGRIRACDGLDAPAFRALLALARVPGAWVKVSGIDRIGDGRRPFHEGIPFIRALVEAMPDRTVWGTDWPHPNVAGDMPDDGEVVDAFFEACPDEAARRRVLVENPARLYGF